MSDQQKVPLTAENYLAVHPAVVEAVAKGEFSLPMLMDSLPWFKTGGDWTPWRAFLCALYGLPMSPVELEIYRLCTGRRTPPAKPSKEVWVAAGRRARKSAVAALIAVWRALFYDYRGVLAPMERAKVPIVAATMREAKQIRAYALAILKTSKLKVFLETDEPPQESIPLSYGNGVDIGIVACNIKAGRSYSSVVGLLDEVAFFADEDGANPDEDIVRGVKAGMSRIPGAFIGGFSSPYARRGLLYKKFQDHYGKEGDVLFWKASSTFMSPGIPQLEDEVAEAYKTDPVAAATEYGAEFRADVLAFVAEEIVDAAITPGRGWNAPVAGVKYFAFCDPAGGSGSDAMTLAIAHADHSRRKVVLDLLVGIEPPFAPVETVRAFAAHLERYGLRFLEGDRYGGDWPADRFREHRIGYQFAEESKSKIYGNWLPALMERAVDLPDDKKLRSQLVALDRRTSRAGDIIDHPPNGHDDYANAAAGALLKAYTIGLRMKPEVHEEAPTTLLEQRNQELWARINAMKEPPSGGSGRYSSFNRSGGR